MNTQESGFTLIEMVMTLVLVVILGGTVVSIISKPVQYYLMLTSMNARVNKGEQAIDFMARELNQALPQTVTVSLDNHMLQFRKIIYQGLVISSKMISSRSSSLLVKTSESDSFYFPYSPEHPLFNPNKGLIFVKNPNALVSRFFIMSSPIVYSWDPKKNILERTAKNQRSGLIADQMQDCQFFPLDRRGSGIIISFTQTHFAGKSISMVKPVFFARNNEYN